MHLVSVLIMLLQSLYLKTKLDYNFLFFFRKKEIYSKND